MLQRHLTCVRLRRHDSGTVGVLPPIGLNFEARQQWRAFLFWPRRWSVAGLSAQRPLRRTLYAHDAVRRRTPERHACSRPESAASANSSVGPRPINRRHHRSGGRPIPVVVVDGIRDCSMKCGCSTADASSILARSTTYGPARFRRGARGRMESTRGDRRNRRKTSNANDPVFAQAQAA